MTDNPFDEYRRYQDLIKRTLGPTLEIQKQLDALKGPLKHVEDMRQTGIFDQVEDMRRTGLFSDAMRTRSIYDDAMKGMNSSIYDDAMKGINRSISHQRLSAITDAAAGVRAFDNSVTAQLRALSEGVDGGILKTIRSLHNQDGLLASVMAATRWQDDLRHLSRGIGGNLAGIRAAAERVMMDEAGTLRASVEAIGKSAALIVAEQAIEAHNLAEALTQAESPEESARLIIAFLAVMSVVFSTLKENTVEHLRKLSLIDLLMITLGIIALPQLQPDMSDEMRTAFSGVEESIRDVRHDLQKIVETENHLNDSYVSSLPMAEIVRKASIRDMPSKDGKRLIYAHAGTPVAIIRSEGRWRLVVYRDPLTNQLAQGWVYGTLVALLNDEG